MSFDPTCVCHDSTSWRYPCEARAAAAATWTAFGGCCKTLSQVYPHPWSEVVVMFESSDSVRIPPLASTSSAHCSSCSGTNRAGSLDLQTVNLFANVSVRHLGERGMVLLGASRASESR